ncbi:putative bifunctional diguanylate cyclase/phosphodiesterase [Alteromonas lipolytica]|uniref:Diguanylate cyclase n=1 Tax=Alteromonas lipolytica TaxID=1856405 RepID=A0A1E8FJE3_9ALTE|nr:EAL domain-containing protein [Alteromonas lipolytica]OFI36044.1 diguanylate cyclase [Alteromonas lipolytica]GGF71431.1 hypothetical protein GCM10011338_24560 [Alteromonas lipolytica]
MFSSIRTTMAVILSLVVMTSSAWVLWLAVAEHEELFLEAQKNNLFALTRNMANDLVPYMEREERDNFALSIVLLRLEPYNNVINATIYDNEFNPVENYFGRGARLKDDQPLDSYADPTVYDMGINIDNGKLFNLERIGEQAFPVGYLLIVNDLNSSLAESRRSLIFRTTPWVILLLAFTIFVSLAVLRRSFKPLEVLSRFTQMVIDTKDYSARHDVKGTSEIKRLGEHINRLMATIEEELSINQQQTQTLMEQQVTMTRLANFDSLTGLPNRQFVMDTIRIELARARRSDGDLILMYFDLDGFKGINDSLGHETGDMILIEVAERVKAILRDGDILARLGGDEFLIIPDRDVTELNMATVSERVLSAFIEPFKLKGLSLKVGVSIGVAKAKEAGYDLSQLVSNADLAMYRSKAKGRGVYTIFNPEMSESHKRKIMIANSIEAAIENNQFCLYYQPKINQQGEIDSLEALIRWFHPELGAVMPSEFILVAEQAGKITAITQWVLNQASKELAELIDIYSPKIRVAINLSVHDLRHSDLFDWIYNAFKSYGVNPENVEFEVTESAYLDNFSSSENLFKRLHNLGCTIALDDFGTGYSSLSYLTQITIDTLKIDRQFVMELDTSERCRVVTISIIDLAKRLSLKICAEGVETHSQWEYLNSLGCDTVQGYLFSKPRQLADIKAQPHCHRQAS